MSGSLTWGRGHVPYGRIPVWLLDADVSDKAIRLYALLATYCRDEGHAFPKKKTLMERMRCGETALRKTANELREIGALRSEPHFRDDGSQAANDYYLEWSDPRESAPLPAPEREGASRESAGLTRAGSSLPLEVVQEEVPSGGALARADEGELVVEDPRSLVAYFVDQGRQRGSPPTPRLNAQMGRYIKQLLADGESPERIKAGIDFMLDRGLANAALLAQFVMEAALTPRRRSPDAAERLRVATERLRERGE